MATAVPASTTFGNISADDDTGESDTGQTGDKPSGPPVAGGGARVENLVGKINKIQAVANRYNIVIIVVGSVASGTAHEDSDIDYIIPDTDSKTRHSALYYLPKGNNGKSEVMPGPLDTNKPYVMFSPNN